MAAAAAHELVFEAFGVHASVVAPDADALAQVLPALPPGWNSSDAASPAVRFELVADGTGYVRVHKDGVALSASLPLAVASTTLERELRIEVALRAPERIFVHAGAVAYRSQGLVLPGATFAGKSTLVAALVRAGATYLSDEYAVLDFDGRIHPYPRPLGIRVDGVVQEHQDVRTLGGTPGEVAVPVTAIAITTFHEGASWQPVRMSPGEAVLALIEHTVPAQTRPTESLRAARQAVDGALLLRSERGDADVAAAWLSTLMRPCDAS
jgi:hypothetical protein